MDRLARDLGFALCRVAAAEPSRFGDEFRQWIAREFHGQMEYLQRNLEVRLDPQRLVPKARSVICVADVYPAGAPGRSALPGPPASGRIARYAWGDDYHRILGRRLRDLADQLRVRWPGHTFRACVDTAPLLEREHAQRAGLGWVGKHTLLIHPGLGSWLCLGGVVTTLPIQPSPQSGDSDRRIVPDHCGTCTRCIEACPTQCIKPGGYEIDASRCISYLTIEHRGPIDPDLHGPMGDWIAGCDVCQEVCPFNGGAPGGRRPGGGREGDRSKDGDPEPAPGPDPGEAAPARCENDAPDQGPVPAVPHPEYAARPPGPAVRLGEVLAWDARTRQQVLVKSALKRIKLDMWKRNALIAAGNVLLARDEPALRHQVEFLAADEAQPELVRQTARQVHHKIQGPDPKPPSASPATEPAARGGRVDS